MYGMNIRFLWSSEKCQTNIEVIWIIYTIEHRPYRVSQTLSYNGKRKWMNLISGIWVDFPCWGHFWNEVICEVTTLPSVVFILSGVKYHSNTIWSKRDQFPDIVYVSEHQMILCHFFSEDIFNQCILNIWFFRCVGIRDQRVSKLTHIILLLVCR